jgi:DNA-binding transcriptional MerR regulator
MKINDVAKKYKITKRSLRYYEEIGLLKSLRVGASQSRYFDNNAIYRLEQILLLRSVKFSIKEISQVLLSDNTDTAFEIFKSRFNELDDKINELNYFKNIISSFITISKTVGINNINIYQLLKEQIYIYNNDERMMEMEKSYEGDIIRLEFGIGIIPLVNPEEGKGIINEIKVMRGKIEANTKREVPLIRVTDNAELNELQYRISIKGKILVDNNLQITSSEDRISEIIRYLEEIINSNIKNL